MHIYYLMNMHSSNKLFLLQLLKCEELLFFLIWLQMGHLKGFLLDKTSHWELGYYGIHFIDQTTVGKESGCLYSGFCYWYNLSCDTGLPEATENNSGWFLEKHLPSTNICFPHFSVSAQT